MTKTTKIPGSFENALYTLQVALENLAVVNAEPPTPASRARRRHLLLRISKVSLGIAATADDHRLHIRDHSRDDNGGS